MPLALPEPCTQDWNDMASRPGGRRHCESCDKSVVDLTRATRSRAEAMFFEAGGELCARVLLDEAGTPVFLGPPKRRSNFAGGLVLVAALTAGGCATRDASSGAEVTQVYEPGASDEPCAIGPAMQPTTLEPPDASVDAHTGQVPASTGESNESPTAEQRRLTQNKHRPPVYHAMPGGMAFHP